MDYQQLRDAVAGTAVGVRARIGLEPLGGPGDKIFPPTYGVNDRAETKYARETRRLNGEDREAVVVDSVASQANRFELALLDAFRSGEIRLPVVSVDFSGAGPDSVKSLGRLSSLETPHRVFDALLRDSLHDGAPFRLSAPGITVTEATPADAAGLFHYSPTTLLFGGWDSTGPKGGLGAKYERAITSEVVALGCSRGVKTASRIDPVGIQKSATIYEGADGEWTSFPDQAAKEKGQPKLYTAKKGDHGRPSQVNHGNVAPNIDDRAGGITADQILAVTVLSFIQLRRLRFPHAVDGTALAGSDRGDAELAARTALAALGLAAAVCAFDDGFDLRSRCVLVPTSPPTFELIGRVGGDATSFTLSRNDALRMVGEASDTARAHGLGWMGDELVLQPADKLVELVRKSHETANVDTDGNEG